MTKTSPKTQLKKITFSIFLFCAVFLGQAQELKFYGSSEVLGRIPKSFTGIGAGFETDLGKHITVNTDLHVGFHEVGTAYQFRPALHLYLSKENKGLFVGPSFKFIRLEEKDNLDRFHDNVYTVGFTAGYKAYSKKNLFYVVSVSPHYAVGASRSPGRKALGSVEGIGFNIGIGYKL
jgi:hypothetical protein